MLILKSAQETLPKLLCTWCPNKFSMESFSWKSQIRAKSAKSEFWNGVECKQNFRTVLLNSCPKLVGTLGMKRRMIRVPPALKSHFCLKASKGGQKWRQHMKNYDEPYLNSSQSGTLLYHVRLCSSEYIFHHRQCDNIDIQRKNQDILKKLHASSSHNKQPCVRITFPKATI